MYGFLEMLVYSLRSDVAGWLPCGTAASQYGALVVGRAKVSAVHTVCPHRRKRRRDNAVREKSRSVRAAGVYIARSCAVIAQYPVHLCIELPSACSSGSRVSRLALPFPPDDRDLSPGECDVFVGYNAVAVRR